MKQFRLGWKKVVHVLKLGLQLIAVAASTTGHLNFSRDDRCVSLGDEYPRVILAMHPAHGQRLDLPGSYREQICESHLSGVQSSWSDIDGMLCLSSEPFFLSLSLCFLFSPFAPSLALSSLRSILSYSIFALTRALSSDGKRTEHTRQNFSADSFAVSMTTFADSEHSRLDSRREGRARLSLIIIAG